MAQGFSHQERQDVVEYVLRYWRDMPTDHLLDSMDWMVRDKPALVAYANEGPLDEDGKRYLALKWLLNFRDQFRHELRMPSCDDPSPAAAPQPDAQRAGTASHSGDLDELLGKGSQTVFLGDRAYALHKKGQWARTTLHEYAKRLDAFCGITS